MVVKVVLTSFASAAVALSLTGCGGSTSSTASSAETVASSAASVASSAVSSATEAAAAQGTLASVCSEIDAVMLDEPDADPAGTAAKLEAIKAKISTPDAELVESVAAAYTAIAASPNDAAVQAELQTSASALGAGCESATATAGP